MLPSRRLVRHRLVRHALNGALSGAALLSGLPAGAQVRAGSAGAQESAPITDVRYDVTFDARTAATRTIRVQMSFGVAGAEPVLLSLPAWTPGAYEISNFARWVSNFAPAQSGKPLAWNKADYDTWRIAPSGAGTVTVSFDYLADTLDNAMAWSRENFALFNGTNVFLYPEGRSMDWASTVVVHTEPSWLVSTGMTPASGTHAFTAPNYHDLVDHPFFVGRFDKDSVRIQGKWVRLSTYPAGSFTGAARATFWDQEKKIFPVENAVMEDAPYPTYDVLIIWDSASGGGSALEHGDSHVGVYTPLLAGSVLLPSISAHEQFHLWNVKRLRPADMWPYRYDRPMPTPWLWASEGITDYYSDLALVRGGVVDSSGFVLLTQAKLIETAQTPPVALTDASINTWIHPTDGTGYIYYQKGSLAGLLLDILIRDGSDNTRGLDDVMRELYRTDYRQGKGFTFDDWWGAVSRAAGGRSFTDIEQRYIDGREPVPWRTVFPLAGFRVRVDTIREPRMGVSTAPDSAGAVRVMTVEPGSAAMQAGIEAGDVLERVGDIAVSDPNFGAIFRQRYATAEGTTVPVVVRRSGKPTTLQLRVVLIVRTNERLEFDPRPSAKALRIRQGILMGRTDK